MQINTNEISSNSLIETNYDIQTLEVMKRVLNDNSNCIDVGCHTGVILKDMLSLSRMGTHFAFEPLPNLYKGLLAKFSHIPNLHIYEFALSDVVEITTFQHIVSNPAYSGLLLRRLDRPNEQIEQIIVKTNLLDNLIPKSIMIQFIKIDVEGAELQVFKGAIETIKRSKPVIVFEHGLGAAGCYNTHPESVYDLLSSQCGLRLFLMKDWLQHNGRFHLNRESFCEQFSKGMNYYFMAAP